MCKVSCDCILFGFSAHSPNWIQITSVSFVCDTDFFFFSEFSLWRISFYCPFNATTRRRSFVLFCCYLFFFMKITILIAWNMVRKWDQPIKENNDKFYFAFFFFHCEKWAQFLVIFHNFVTIFAQLINLKRKKWHNSS